MAVVELACLVLPLPILLKTRRLLRENAPNALWMVGVSAFTQLVPVVWAIVVAPAWVFAFDGCRPLFGQGAMIVVALLGTVPLGVLAAIPVGFLMAELLPMDEDRRRLMTTLRRNAGAIAGSLVPSLIAGALLITMHNDLLNGIGLDVATFMLLTGPVPLAIYVGVLLWRRRHPISVTTSSTSPQGTSRSP